MTDLITAARKQIEYANNILAGRFPKAGEHLAKADDFLSRAATDKPATAAAASASDDAYTRPDGGYSRAATLDASAIANRNAGGNPTPEFDKYDGQAQKEGYTGVVGASGAGELKVYTVFKDGTVIATVNGDGSTDTSALAEQHGI